MRSEAPTQFEFRESGRGFYPLAACRWSPANGPVEKSVTACSLLPRSHGHQFSKRFTLPSPCSVPQGGDCSPRSPPFRWCSSTGRATVSKTVGVGSSPATFANFARHGHTLTTPLTPIHGSASEGLLILRAAWMDTQRRGLRSSEVEAAVVIRTCGF